MNRHLQLVRDRYLKEIHEKMLKHHITSEELEDFAQNRYFPKDKRMQQIRNEKVMLRKNLENLAKARAAKAAKKEIK